jgi:L-lactate dehydrogenase complex protein LldG
MSRETILANIRAALGPADGQRAEAVAARLADPPPPLVPARTNVSQPKRIEELKAYLAAQSTDLIVAAEPAAIPGAIAAYLRDRALPLRLRKGSDPYLAGLPWQSAGLVVDEGPARPDDDVGVSRAIAAIAETGTLMLASGPENPVTLALVPETHIVVVRSETVVGGYEEACELVAAERGSAALPRTLNLVSGASRTGDIGGKIVMGAHGPRRLAVVMVEEA